MLEAVVRELTKAVLSGAAGELGARPINAVLDALLNTNADELAALSRIDRTVQDLRQGPFNTGVTFLEEARKAHRDAVGRRRDLENAREEFIRAIGHERSNPARSALIRIHLGVTALALDQYIDAEDHLERAYQSLSLAYRPAKTESTGWSVFGRSRTPGNAELLLPYVNAVTRLRVSLGALPTSVPHVVLMPSGSLEVASWMFVPLSPEQRRRSRAWRYQDGGRLRRLASVSQPWPLAPTRPTQPPIHVNLWGLLLPFHSNELLRIARTDVPGPEMNWLLLRLRPGRGPRYWRDFEIRAVKRVARDIVAERRSGWPTYQKHALPDDVKRLLWPRRPAPNLDESNPAKAIPAKLASGTAARRQLESGPRRPRS